MDTLLKIEPESIALEVPADNIGLRKGLQQAGNGWAGGIIR
jgi:hypothetical protein